MINIMLPTYTMYTQNSRFQMPLITIIIINIVTVVITATTITATNVAAKVTAILLLLEGTSKDMKANRL